MPRPTRLPTVPLVLSTLLAFPMIPCAGQPQPLEPPRTGLSPDPFQVDELAMSFRPPAASITQVRRLSNRVEILVAQASPVPAWSMQISAAPPIGPDSTARNEIARRLEGWTEAGRAWKTASENARTYGGRDAYAWFVEYTAAPEAPPVITGWIVIDRGPDEFLFATVQTIPEELPRLLPLLDASFQSIHLLDRAVLERAVETRLEAGAALLATFTPQRLEKLDGVSSWTRHFRPGAGPNGGDVEIGWLNVSVREAPRGALNPARPPANYDPSEETEGMLVEVYGRMVESVQYDVVIDSEMLFWLAWDQSEEIWTIRLTRRQGKRTQSEAVTGIRAPRTTSNPRGTLAVIATEKDGSVMPVQSPAVPEPYLSQALTWVLGQLLPREGREPRTFAYHTYDGNSGQLAVRTDRWEPADDGSGNWTLTSLANPDAPTAVGIYGAAGELIRQTWPDGSVSETTTEAEVRRRWEPGRR